MATHHDTDNPTGFADQAVFIEDETALRARACGMHIDLLVEDWNEPDLGYEAFDSSVVITGVLITVTTPVRMAWAGDPEDAPSYTDTVVVATYHVDDRVPRAIVCFEAGKGVLGSIAYHDNTGLIR